MLSPRTRNWNIQSASLPNLDDCRPCTQLPNTKHCPACLMQLQFPVKFHMAAHLDAPTQSTKSTFSHRRGLEDHWNTVPDLHDVTRTAPRRMQSKFCARDQMRTFYQSHCDLMKLAGLCVRRPSPLSTDRFVMKSPTRDIKTTERCGNFVTYQGTCFPA